MLSSFARALRLAIIVSILFSGIPLTPTFALYAQPSLITFAGPLQPTDQTFLGPLPLLASPPPALEMTLQAEPAGIAPDKIVTFTLSLSNTGSVAASSVVLSATVPNGLQWISGQPGWSYNAITRRLSANVGALDPGEGVVSSARLLASEPVDHLATLTIKAQSEGEMLGMGRASVWVAHPTQATIGPQGGVLQSADGLARVVFPAGAFSAPTQVSYQRYAPRPGSPLHFGQDQSRCHVYAASNNDDLCARMGIVNAGDEHPAGLGALPGR